MACIQRTQAARWIALVFAAVVPLEAQAQFNRPPKPVIELPVSRRQKLVIMTRPADEEAYSPIVAFSPDDAILYVSTPKIWTIPLQPIPPKEERRRRGGGAANITPIHGSVKPGGGDGQGIHAISADGTCLLGIDSWTVFCVLNGEYNDLADGSQLHDQEGIETEYVSAVAMADDARRFACAFGNDLFVFRLLNQKGQLDVQELDHIEGHLQAIDGLAFSHDGKLLASTSADGSTRLWDVSDLR